MMSRHMTDCYSHANKVCHLDYVSDDYFLQLMRIYLIILYVPVVLGKVYDSKRPGRDLAPLKISRCNPCTQSLPKYECTRRNSEVVYD